MKKFMILVLSIMVLAGCSDDSDSNVPSLQGVINHNDFFHSSSPTAKLNDDGSVTMTGKDGGRILSLTIASAQPGQTYDFGEDPSTVATFNIIDSTFYSTDSLGMGQITIGSTENNTLSGSFYIYARVNGDTGDTLNIEQGAFFGVPIVNAVPDSGTDPECIAATQAAQAAAQVYAQAQENGNPDEIETACGAYAQALQAQIDACSDPNGEIQATLDGLDCGA